MTQNPDGSESFQWQDSHLKLRVTQPDGTHTIITPPNGIEDINELADQIEALALAAGLDPSEGTALNQAFRNVQGLWSGPRLLQLNQTNSTEAVEILEFDLNEFLNVSTQLKAKQVFYLD